MNNLTGYANPTSGSQPFTPTSPGYEAARINALGRYTTDLNDPNAPKNEQALDEAISDFLQKGVITPEEAVQIYKDAGLYGG